MFNIPHSSSGGPASKKIPWSRESTFRDIGLILLLSAFMYLPFLGLPVWDGHEPMRVIVSSSMLQSGNWIIPMLHGKVYLIKPPLMNWLIATSGAFFGTLNEWTSRIPSALLMAATGVSVYGLTGRWLSTAGRLFAGIATISMIGLIEKGREADMDSLFIFFVALILLLWLNGYSRKWKPLQLWSMTLLLLSVGFLAKGPQILAFFYLTVFAYLLLRKDAAFFFSREHLIGLLLFIGVLSVYLFFVMQQVPFLEYLSMWIDQITQRGESRYSHAFLKHIVTYPLEAIASFMPWSVFVAPILFHRESRREVSKVVTNEIFLFALVMVAVNFPLYWVLKSARVRYFLPAGPFVAIGIAALYDHYWSDAKHNPRIVGFFRGFLKVFCWLAVIIAIALVPLIPLLKLSFSPAIFFLMTALTATAVIILHRMKFLQITGLSVSTAILTGFVFLTYTYLDIQSDSQKTYNPKKIASQINAALSETADTVYVMGYRRQLDITCYLKKEVVQLDNLSELVSLLDKAGAGDRIYFISDVTFLKKVHSDTEHIRGEEISWRKAASFPGKERDVEIILAYLEKKHGEL